MDIKNQISLEASVMDAYYSIKRVGCLLESTYDRYFGKEPEDVRGLGEESFRQFYEEVQLSLQGIRELLAGAIRSGDDAKSILEGCNEK